MNIPKTYLLSGVLLALIATSWILAITDSRPDPQQNEDNPIAIENSSLISSIVLAHNDSVVLRLEEGGWQLNYNEAADANNIQLLLAILEQIEIDRPIAKRLYEEWWARLNREGTRVDVSSNDQVIRSFLIGGDSAKAISYIVDTATEKIYEVKIPGYNTYLAEIFERPASHWKDRRVFATSWQTLVKIKTEYPKQPEESFEIYLEETGYKVPGVTQIDTARLFSFLDGITFLTLRQFVDTALTGQPLLFVEVQDVDPNKSRRLALYPDPEAGQKYYGKLAEEWAIIDQDLVSPLLVKKSELVSKN